ncbi:MAG: DUF952 domain-containing protein [Chitinivibrionales bacterium]|nr:DUF952 domain-containing protein [Chitinivibrionales bacterium]
MILHITTRREWSVAAENGAYTAPSLQTEGFIHCSKPEQVADTANAFFRNQKGLVLLCIDEKMLKSEYRFEKPAGAPGSIANHDENDLFPHVYGPLNTDAVIRIVDFPSNADGVFALPEEITNE